MPFAQEQLGFERPPKLFLRQDSDNAADPLGKTAFYDPNKRSITLFITDRHPKDVLRSLSHELVHHIQNCRGDFDNTMEMGEGYAQNDEHLREMEREAYERGNLLLRDWEDGIKNTTYSEHLQKGGKNHMSNKSWKNRELNGLLMERFGFNFKPLVEGCGCEVNEEDVNEEEVIEEEDVNECGEMAPDEIVSLDAEESEPVAVEELAAELLIIAQKISDSFGEESSDVVDLGQDNGVVESTNKTVVSEAHVKQTVKTILVNNLIKHLKKETKNG